MQSWFVILSFILISFPEMALSQTIKVSAEYKPAAYETSGGRFISTTPCVKTSNLYWVDLCKGGVTSLDNLLFSISQSVSRTVKKDVTKSKDSIVYLQAFSQKKMAITSPKANTYQVEFIPKMLGVDLGVSIPSNIATPIYAGLAAPNGGCKNLGKSALGYYTWTDLIVLWGPVAGNSCYADLSIDTNIKVRALLFGFEINPPSPLDMPNGVYTGSITLSVSSDGDISLGNGIYSDTKLTIDLTLTVRHQLKVDFPKSISEGKSNVILLPPNGWHDWLGGNKKTPTFLQQKIPFHISYSAPYTVTLRCQYTSGQSCALKNAKNHQVVINSLYVDRRNQTSPLMTTSFKKFGLYEQAPVIDTEEYILFRTPDDSFKQMVKYPGSTYKGDITLIFDAAID